MRPVGVLVLLLLLAACTDVPGPGPEGAAATPTPVAERPNVLVVVTDDMRVDGLQAMPFTVKWLVGGGRTYTNAYATTPLCCPSRASIFTGLYAHNHGVLKNKDSHDLDASTTMQAHLQEAGYRTALAGKYLNSWNVREDPPYFDRWASYSGRYYGKPFNVDGTPTPTDDYSTYHIGKRATGFLADFERRDDQPWFLYVATVAPHTPFTIPSHYRGADVPVLGRGKVALPGPAPREEDVSDKPGFQGRQFALERPGKLARKQWRLLLPVDDIMRNLRNTLRRFDEERDTIVVFTSDQGLMQGEHGLYAKRLPYTESIQVPMLVRWPGHVEAGRDETLVANVDIAPTVLGLAGAAVTTDGRSLLGGGERGELFLEQLDNWRVGLPDWRALRGSDFQYIEYYDRKGELMEREYYDLAQDPFQHTNLLGDDDPANDPDTTAMSERLASYRDCTGDGCWSE